MYVIKRDGKQEEFTLDKIANAIKGANKDVSDADKLSENDIQEIASIIMDRAHSLSYALNVEEIQDMVEDEINRREKFALGRAYSQYRFKRALIRKTNTTDGEILSLIDYKNEEVKQENSNKNPRIASVQRDYMAGATSKDITKRYILADDIIQAHENGIIHFHDMDYFLNKIVNCCLVNLKDMLMNGTVISGVMIEKPHSFSTACNIMTQIMAQIASSQYGSRIKNFIDRRTLKTILTATAGFCFN